MAGAIFGRTVGLGVVRVGSASWLAAVWVNSQTLGLVGLFRPKMAGKPVEWHSMRFDGRAPDKPGGSYCSRVSGSRLDAKLDSIAPV